MKRRIATVVIGVIAMVVGPAAINSATASPVPTVRSSSNSSVCAGGGQLLPSLGVCLPRPY